jgi:hypothetical protein
MTNEPRKVRASGITRTNNSAVLRPSRPENASDDTKLDWFAAARLPIGPLGWKDLATALAIIWGLHIALELLTFSVLEIAVGPGWRDDLQFRHILPAITLSWLGALITIWYFSCRRYWRPLGQVFALRITSRRITLLSLLLGVVSAIVLVLTMVVFAPDGAEHAPIVKLVFGQAGDGSKLFSALIVFIAAAITFPVFEELYYRGFLYGVLEGLVGRIAAAIIVAVWFGLVHAPQVGFGLVAMIVIMLVSTLLTWLRYKYDSLIPALSAHVAYNGTLSLAAMIGFALS